MTAAQSGACLHTSPRSAARRASYAPLTRSATAPTLSELLTVESTPANRAASEAAAGTSSSATRRATPAPKRWSCLAQALRIGCPAVAEAAGAYVDSPPLSAPSARSALAERHAATSSASSLWPAAGTSLVG